MKSNDTTGQFFEKDGERWYRIEAYDSMPPFFVALTGDSDLWAFVSTNGSLAAGRRDQEQSFFPYETVDKIHTRWETTGPRTWISFESDGNHVLWEPFARRPGWVSGTRTISKNLTGTRLLFEDINPDGNLCFSQEWSTSGSLGLVRKLSIRALIRPVKVRVLDGLLNLLPPGENNSTYNALSSLADAYKWNESHAGGRVAIYTMYAQLWDRAEPKESLDALAVWCSGIDGAKTLLSTSQVDAFCAGRNVTSETLTRGERGAFLLSLELQVGFAGTNWYQVIDGPLSQTKAADLATRLESGWGNPSDIETSLTSNAQGLDELLVTADGFQASRNEMAAFHHTGNVLFNIMRGGVFPLGTTWDTDDLKAFVVQRNHSLSATLDEFLKPFHKEVDRRVVLEAVREHDPQLERLVREYLPLTYSRRHGDPSRPWNKFSIKVRDGNGRRVLNHQGNWRDIFQNWEALLWSQPEYVGSMISTFLSSMTPDGYNPYRITRDGIEWETVEDDDPWSYVGYWGDHQVVYLLKFLEAAQAFEPGLLADLWNRPVFSFANIPYRLKSYADIVKNAKFTIDFDQHAHDAAMLAASTIGGDGKLMLGASGQPVLGTLAEKLLTIVLSKAGNLVPGGGIWLNTQRPEWNDANNALVGNGLSLVTLAALRRFLKLLEGLPILDEALELPVETASALEAFVLLTAKTPLTCCTEPRLRRAWLDHAGQILETWRSALYQGWMARATRTVPGGVFRSLIINLLPLVEKTLLDNERDDGLYHSYNLLTLKADVAEVAYLYPMLEGQVSMMSSGLLDANQVLKLGNALKKSALYDSRRKSYLLYPDRALPGFLDKNILDAPALAANPIQKLLAAGRTDIFQIQTDGTTRFASHLANRYDVERTLNDDDSCVLTDAEVSAVADTYERLLCHKEFTGRSGTMFAYEGLGCIYWHMVAKLLLAVQENIFIASDANSPVTEELKLLYQDIRAGLGYKKTPTEYGAFPFDPYSHTPSQGGAQQPGMTGQVKEEILTRWGELGLRWNSGQLMINPVLFDPEEIPEDGLLEFTYRRVPFVYRRQPVPGVRIRTSGGWESCANGVLPKTGVLAVEIGI